MADIPLKDPLATQVTEVLRRGDLAALKQLLAEQPELATSRLVETHPNGSRRASRTLLHVLTDWPGHFPRGAESVAALVAAGADVNARFEGPHGETPLHWAASTDDVSVLDALLDHGADLESSGAVIGGGTPIADAAAFGQWNAARRLAERGAQTPLWVAAALGLMDRVKEHFSGNPLPPWTIGSAHAGDAPPDETTHAFWCACHGGQLETAEFLLNLGANINWIGYDRLTPLGAAQRAGADDLVAWLATRGAR
jgi:ankyrin repeat protein